MTSIATDPALLEILRTLRSSLHACPESAGNEMVTARIVANFLQAYAPDALLTNLGGYGVAAVFEGASDGPTVLFRCELDALAVTEAEHVDTLREQASHRCGHDGHMAMLAGLAPLVSSERPASGRVVLLFQPAEETGKGALRILEDSQFPSIQPDYAIALHNLPGVALNTVLSRQGTFASASGGVRIQLRGIDSHAAEPEAARSPRKILAQLLTELPTLSDVQSDPYHLVTVTHVQMGGESFGLTPGNATLCATLRSSSSESLELLFQKVESLSRNAAGRDGLDVEISKVEWFPASHNDSALVELLEQCCERAHIEYQQLQGPLRWSEDFAHFSRICPTLHFGLGIGETALGLHHPEYSFPDDVIPTGLTVFYAVMRKLTSGYTIAEVARDSDYVQAL